MQKLIPFSLAVLLGLSLGGCAFPGVYKIDIQQGNIVKQEDLDRLESGMSREDVRFVLGTPLAGNTLRKDRDHYLYTFQDSGGAIVQQRVTVFYSDNRYDRHTANLLPETPAY
jgi:outer membrane protein assembly factor BamE